MFDSSALDTYLTGLCEKKEVPIHPKVTALLLFWRIHRDSNAGPFA